MSFLTEWLPKLAEGIILALIAACFRLWLDMQRLKDVVTELVEGAKERKTVLKEVSSVEADHETRIRMLEKAIDELRDLAPELREFTGELKLMGVRQEAMLDSLTKRLDLIERFTYKHLENGNGHVNA